MKVLACIVFVVLTVSWVEDVHGFDCPPCNPDHCQALPSNCQVEKGICGCCDVCRLGTGERCSTFTPNCETGLVCRNEVGQELANGEWNWTFIGTCQ